MMLAILWASLANAVPATFWSLAFLLLPENKPHLDAALSELKDEVAKEVLAPIDRPLKTDKRKGSHEAEEEALSRAAFTLAINRKSAISRCVAEAIRLRVHSIDLRIAAADLSLTSSAGDVVSVACEDAIFPSLQPGIRNEDRLI